MNQDIYEKELRARQEAHINNSMLGRNMAWKPCAHDQCTNCHGTGLDAFGSMCIHSIACDCPKCRRY